ncbi:hypothetical protein ACFLZL_00910 [Thermodesulfobacteriota bacterium]
MAEIAKCPSNGCPLWCFRKGRLDKSIKIVPVPENNHIEAFSENKKENAYQSIYA